jgi:hypothetical protein
MSYHAIRRTTAWLLPLLATFSVLTASPAAFANDNPFVGKEWLIKFAVDSPRAYFPASTYQTRPLLVVEHYQHRWYKIRFTYSSSDFDGNPPEQVRGTEDEFWISADQIVSWSPPIANEPGSTDRRPNLPARTRGGN